MNLEKVMHLWPSRSRKHRWLWSSTDVNQAFLADGAEQLSLNRVTSSSRTRRELGERSELLFKAPILRYIYFVSCAQQLNDKRREDLEISMSWLDGNCQNTGFVLWFLPGLWIISLEFSGLFTGNKKWHYDHYLISTYESKWNYNLKIISKKV